MITRSDFFDALAKGALWDVGVAINRTNPLPLDKFSVFKSLGTTDDTGTDTALGYAMNSVIAYPGQIIAVVSGTNDAPNVNIYSIIKTGKASIPQLILKELASQGSYTQLDSVLNQLNQEVVKAVIGDKAVKATKAGNAVTLATQTSAVEGNILEIKDDGLYVPTPEAVTVPEYSIVKDATSSDFAAVYHLTKDNVNTGVAINIPKDKFLKSVTLEHYEAGSLPTGVTAPGTYLKFVFENITDPVYLNVNEFLDGVIYTGGTDSKGTELNKYSTIQVNVDPLTHVITASILDGGVHTDELADSAVTTIKIADNAVTEKKILNGAVTADKIAAGAVTETKIADNAVTEGKIKDGAVTLDKLSSGVQASLGNADSAIRKVKVNGTELTPDTDKAVNVTVATGTANGHIAVNGVDVKVAGLGTAAYEAKGAFDAAGAAAAVLGNSETDTAESITVHGVKKKAEANTTAITELQNGKVDKITAGPTEVSLYAVSTKGETPTQTLAAVGTSKTPSITSIPEYDDYSNLTVNETPKNDTDATSKKYVDDAVNTAVSSGVTVETTGKGKYVTAVTKTDGKISVTKSTPAIAITEVTNLESTLNAKATTEDLNQAKADLSGEIIAAQNELSTAIGKKQDVLAFEGDYNIETNKVVTKSAMDSAISTATAGLTGAMHFVGNSTSNPLGETGPTITGHTGAFKSGDVCTYNKKEFVYDGTSWRELGDEGSYAVKGAIKDSDIAADAAIAQSKIDGLTTALNGKVSSARIFGKEEIGPSTINQTLTISNGQLNIPIATETQFGTTKVVLDKDNGFTYMNSNNDYMEKLSIYSVTTDILKNGTKTLILNGGGAAL